MGSPKAENIWANAIRKCVHEYDEVDEGGVKQKVRNINILAKIVVASAKRGDMQAMKEIGDRLDGKPRQSVTGTFEAGDSIVNLLKAIDGASRGIPSCD